MNKKFTKHLLAATLIAFAGSAVAQKPLAYKSTNQLLINTPISVLKPKHNDTTIVPYYVTQFNVGSTLTDPLNATFDDNFMYISEDGASDHIRRVDLSANPITSTIIANESIVGSPMAAPLGLVMGDFTITSGQKTLRDFYFVAQASKKLYYANPNAAGNYTFTEITPASPITPFNYPHDIVHIPNSNPTAYIISDRGNEIGNRLLKFTPSAATQFEVIAIPSAELWEPASLAFDASNNLYVVKSVRGNKKILKINMTTGDYATLIDLGTAAAFPIAIEDDRLFYRSVNTILVANKNTGETIYTASPTTGDPSVMNRHNFSDPFSIKKNPTDGNLYVASKGHDRIEMINLNKYTVSPALPTGLILDPITGEITGTPTALSSKQIYTISIVTNAATAETKATDQLEIEVVATLPVTLASFEAKKQTNGSVSLTWGTSSETDNSKFVLSRSTNGANFSTLVERASLGAQGGTYNFTDIKPSSGANYYKLQQVDNDGTTKDLGIKVVQGGLVTAAWSVYPNPSKGNKVTVNYSGNSTTQTAKVYDVAGRLVHSQVVTLNGETIISFNPALARGIYTISLGSLGAQKLIVQ